MVNAVLDDAVRMGLTVVRIWAMIDIGSLPNTGARGTIDGKKESMIFYLF